MATIKRHNGKYQALSVETDTPGLQDLYLAEHRQKVDHGDRSRHGTSTISGYVQCHGQRDS